MAIISSCKGQNSCKMQCFVNLHTYWTYVSRRPSWPLRSTKDKTARFYTHICKRRFPLDQGVLSFHITLWYASVTVATHLGRSYAGKLTLEVYKVLIRTFQVLLRSLLALQAAMWPWIHLKLSSVRLEIVESCVTWGFLGVVQCPVKVKIMVWRRCYQRLVSETAEG